MVDSVVNFDAPSIARSPKVSELDLKLLATTFQGSLRARGLAVGDLFGSSTDLWGFSIDFKAYEILFSVSPSQVSPQQWSADVTLDDPGWFKTTRADRLAEMKRVEQAVHDALIIDLKARNIEWLLGKGNVRHRQRRSEP